MRKKAWLFGILMLLTAALSTNAFAEAGDGGNSWTNFWNGVGTFVHNVMPWNWGK